MRKTWLLTASGLVLLGATLVVLGAAWKAHTPGSGTGASDLPFDIVAQGNSTTARTNEPTLLIVSAPAQAVSLTALAPYDPRLADQMTDMDLTEKVVVAIFPGQVSSGGYEVAIQRMTLAGKKVRIMAQVNTPPPGGRVTAVISYPYQVVSISREALPLQSSLTWEVYDQTGKLLAQTRYP